MNLHEKIVQRFGLKRERGDGFGNTFVNDVKIYRFEKNIIMAECDTMGDPTPGKWLIFKDGAIGRLGYTYAESEFLLNLPISEFRKIVNYEK